MSEAKAQLLPASACKCGSDECPECTGWSKWFDNHSWQPQADLPSPSVVQEAQPGSIAYLEQGLDELYVSLGGEG